jgi:hypothetical protein
VPGSHKSHATALVFSEYEPGGHAKHSPIPGRSAYVPTPQGRHADSSVLLVSGKNNPGAQSTHRVWPYRLWYWPSGHSVQLPVPTTSEKDPGGHSKQLVAFTWPNEGLKNPGTHP